MTRSSEPDKASAQAALIELADLTAPYAVRAAVGLGLPTLVKEGSTTFEELTQRCAPIRSVRSLVNLLTLKGVFVQPPSGGIALTAVGDMLTMEQARLMLDPREIGSQFALALSALPQAALSGAAGYEIVTGRSFWQTLQGDAALAASFDRYMAEWAAQWIPDVLAARDWSKDSHVVELFGSGERDRDDFARLFEASGLRLIDARPIGHDLTLIECAPASRRGGRGARTDRATTWQLMRMRIICVLGR